MLSLVVGSTHMFGLIFWDGRDAQAAPVASTAGAVWNVAGISVAVLFYAFLITRILFLLTRNWTAVFVKICVVYAFSLAACIFFERGWLRLAGVSSLYGQFALCFSSLSIWFAVDCVRSKVKGPRL